MSDAGKIVKARPPRLGRGLSSLMAHPVEVPAAPPPGAGAATAGADASSSESPGDGQLRYLPTTALRPNPHQPRQHFDAESLARLAESIRSAGMMQPIIVRPAGAYGGGDAVGYQIVAGERRWRAAQLAELATVPAIVRDLDDGQLAAWALIENLQREDLNPMERANAFQHLIDQFSLTHEQVAERVGVERSTISNALRLLNLHPTVQDMLARDLLSAGQAKALTAVADPDRQVDLAKRAVREDWPVRRLEAAIRATGQDQPAGLRGPTPRSAHYADLEKQIGESLGTKVRLKPGRRKGAGTLSIDYYSIDQFDALLGRLGVTAE